MAVKLSRSQLPLLLQKLRPLFPDNIKICGELKCKLENRSQKLCGFDFLVDTWPNFSTVISRPDNTNNRLKFIDNHHSVLTQDREKLREILENSDVIKWTSPIVQFADVREDLYDVISEAADSHGFHAKLSFTYLAMFVDSEMASMPVPEGLVMRPLSEDHAEIVMNNVDYSGEGSVEYCKELIKHYQSLAMFDENNNLVAYTLETNHGVSGMARVMPNYRHKHIGLVLLSQFDKLLVEEGRRMGGWVNVENNSMRRLMRKLGCTEYPQKHIWIDCFKK
ncbi:hypothetical protein LOTGIDRAFT_239764 [Lottia gigantea]|uniref:Glycine N-acyltransferase-like protein n=1 Tax=Lottia gigantea TaxID=225164 RepID=V4A4C1_LOTGI|nr:hypothetical protein LOTGIDRAFT_239764 [Lottia gigantea]ESO91542.1 hypothetical protein LOTGIDRAFT_239764 [Lottia gigantea]